MTFGNPVALFGLLASIPIIACFLFRRRPVVLEIPSVMLWRQAVPFQQMRWFGKKPNKWLTLAAQLLILCLLVLILADPNPNDGRGHCIIILDDSGTMQTQTGEGTRFEGTQETVHNIITAAPDDNDFTMILAGEPPLVPFATITDRSAIDRFVEQHQPRDVDAHVDEAIEIARRYATQSGRSRIFVITDTPSHEVHSDPDIDWLTIDHNRPNLAITSMQYLDGGTGVRVTLDHIDMQGTPVIARMICDEELLAETSADLAEGLTQVEIRARPKPGQSFSIVILPDDSLPLDNCAYGVWPPSLGQRIRVVTSGNSPLLAALMQPDTQIEISGPKDLPADPSDGFDLVVWDAPHDISTRKIGHHLVLGGEDPFGLCGERQGTDNLRPTHWSTDSPLTRDVDFFSWLIHRSASMDAAPGVQSIVSAVGVPLVLATVPVNDTPSFDHRVFSAVYFNFSLSDSNLADPGSFRLPIVLWRAVATLTGRTATDQRLAYRTGQPIAIPLDAKGAVEVLDPRMQVCPAQFEDGLLTLFQPTRVGQYTIVTETGKSHLGVSWFRTMPLPDTDGTKTPFVASATSEQMLRLRSLSPVQLLLLICAGMIAAEGWLFYRFRLRFA
ncbi:MAG: hypothetical protein B6D36_09250 [Planctomycetes bacterium UTPLA1]|nr:MAG: hypothetical protein B6D36_09250 [Planctomycetes bacterium UTPLA1]